MNLYELSLNVYFQKKVILSKNNKTSFYGANITRKFSFVTV